MTSEEAIAWIHGRKDLRDASRIDASRSIATTIRQSRKNLTLIHVAGTNGKGSTVSYLRSLLEESGLQVGTFTSPHIESFNERIEIDGRFIPDDSLIEWVETLQPLVMQLDQEEELTGITQFEILTALAFGYFAQQQVDVAIIEVGLGGRLDSTNVITPILTAITTIGMDHMDMLGDTIEAIAARQSRDHQTQGATSDWEDPLKSALSVSTAEAAESEAPVSHLGEDYRVTYHRPDEIWGEWFDLRYDRGKIKRTEKRRDDWSTPTENAGVAIQLYYLFCELKKQLPFSEKVVRNGLKKLIGPRANGEKNQQ